jgi:hypothetical protein
MTGDEPNKMEDNSPAAINAAVKAKLQQLLQTDRVAGVVSELTTVALTIDLADLEHAERATDGIRNVSRRVREEAVTLAAELVSEWASEKPELAEWLHTAEGKDTLAIESSVEFMDTLRMSFEPAGVKVSRPRQSAHPAACATHQVESHRTTMHGDESGLCTQFPDVTHCDLASHARFLILLPA